MKIYHIHSHDDADGGIAAAIFQKHIESKYKGWKCRINPQRHNDKELGWALTEIQSPSAILDFTIHPHLLNPRFLKAIEDAPPCFWIDHHPTGSPYSFITPQSLASLAPLLQCLWDTSATSTPGLFRKHYEVLGISKDLIMEYEKAIDIAEIIDGALFVEPDDAYDFSSLAVKVQYLFHPSHPLIQKEKMYKQLVQNLVDDSDIEAIVDKDPVYQATLTYEQERFYQQMEAYKQVCVLKDNIAVCDFSKNPYSYKGFGRFIPYMLYPKSQYGLHIFPQKEGFAISCGVNPWNSLQNKKHLGFFFSQNFNGGGHEFVAGGRVNAQQVTEVFPKIKNFLQGAV